MAVATAAQTPIRMKNEFCLLVAQKWIKTVLNSPKISEAYWYPCNITVKTMNCKTKIPVHIESYFLRIIFSEIELQWVKYILLKSTNTGLTSELPVEWSGHRACYL